MNDDASWFEDALTGAVTGELLSRSVGPLVRKAIAEWAPSRRRIKRAIERSALMSYEDVMEEMEKDPRLVPLHTRVLISSIQTGHEKVLDALGGTFGVAVADRSRLDEAELLLIAIRDLAGHHFKLLALLSEPPPEPSTGVDPQHRWGFKDLAGRVDWSDDVTRLTLHGLQGSGLVRDRSTVNAGSKWAITDLGRTMVDVMAVVDGA